MNDLRLAFRQLAKSKGFTVIAIATLALAIGVNSAVFSLVDAFAFRPAVSLRPEELVNLFNGREGGERRFRLFSHDEYLALREAKDTFADVAAISMTSAGIAGADGVRKNQAFFTSENYFAMLGAQPALGRFYTADECRPNAGIPVVVASYALWQRHGGRPDFVGSTLRVNGKPYTVVGVTPEKFNGVLVLVRTDLWLPLGVFGEFTAGSRSDLAAAQTQRLNLTARLASGVSRAALSARLPALSQRLTAIQSDESEGPRQLHAEEPSRDSVGNQPRSDDPSVPVAIGVFFMSGCVLLIACLNLANMLLARGAARAKEIAVRLSLGAGRWRIVRQLVIEGLLLAGAGGAVGLLLAFWGNDFLLHSLPAIFSGTSESLLLDARPDARVMGVTFLLCLVATLFFSVGPALKASRVDLVHHLKQQGDQPAGGGRLHRFFSLSHCLVMGQIALSLMLLFSAGLFLRGAFKASTIATGFDPSRTLVADLDYSLTSLLPADAQRSLFATVERLRQQPGAAAAAAATFVPYSARKGSGSVRPAGMADPAFSFSALCAAITSDYFQAAGVRLIRGRDFTAAEARDATAHVAIIDEVLAGKLFPAGDALGRRVQVDNAEREIVGICAPHRHDNRRAIVPHRVFLPYAAGHDGRAFLLVRYATEQAASALLRPALRSIDAELPVLQVATFPSMVESDYTSWLARFGATLFGLFGMIALSLAVIGVYGVKAYAVARRTREIGIRMALGAQSRDVIRLLLKQGVGQILVATCAGLLLAFGAGKILGQMLYQVSPTDPLLLTVSVAVLTLAALLACWLPARRATKVDPMVALRAD